MLEATVVVTIVADVHAQMSSHRDKTSGSLPVVTATWSALQCFLGVISGDGLPAWLGALPEMLWAACHYLLYYFSVLLGQRTMTTSLTHQAQFTDDNKQYSMSRDILKWAVRPREGRGVNEMASCNTKW